MTLLLVFVRALCKAIVHRATRVRWHTEDALRARERAAVAEWTPPLPVTVYEDREVPSINVPAAAMREERPS